MLYANINNGEVILVERNEVVKMANYDELMDSICCGIIEVGYLTMIKDGIVIWNEDECEMDFIRLH